ncbi:MAG: ABC transporter ATP-binding protein [Desulfobacterales bacterium]|jgi:tungstate transport system ATP-binding protein
MSIFSLSNVTREYGLRTVLDIRELEIPEYQIHALLGPNGAGKTTLLNILGFLQSPTSGKITYRSKPVSFIEAELQQLRREVVLVDQHPILFTTSVYKNLEFGLKIRGIPSGKRRHIIQETLELVGMRSFINAPAHQLSGGETQRVALARGLALSPRVLLCDEPTSSVDVENQTTIVNILRRINDLKEITVIFTTHDRLQAAGLAQRILVLNQGRLVPATYDNIFSGQMYYGRDGQARCRIQENISLKLAPEQAGKELENVRVFIDPAQIDIADACYSDASIPNTVKGRVVQLMEENGHIRAVVDAGILITLMLERSRYEHTRPFVGDVLLLIIPPESIRTL